MKMIFRFPALIVGVFFFVGAIHELPLQGRAIHELPLQAATGQIRGKVVDTRGVAIRDATVTATNKDSGLVREAETDQAGEYRLASLPAGRYSLTVRHAEFQTFEAADVVVDEAAVVTQDAKLLPAEVSAAVGLTSATPLGKPKPRAVSPDQLRQEATELAQLAEALPAEIKGTSSGQLPKDLNDRLRRIEKLAKKLRRDLGVR